MGRNRHRGHFSFIETDGAEAMVPSQGLTLGLNLTEAMVRGFTGINRHIIYNGYASFNRANWGKVCCLLNANFHLQKIKAEHEKSNCMLNILSTLYPMLYSLLSCLVHMPVTLKAESVFCRPLNFFQL